MNSHFETLQGCTGCSMFADNVCELAHLCARHTSFTLVSRAPLANIEPYKRRMGWTMPWVSSAGSDFNDDLGVTVEGHETFGLSVFIRDGNSIYRSYVTAGRGVETLGTVWTFLDLTPLGRQEAWEDSPEGCRKLRHTKGGAGTTNTTADSASVLVECDPVRERSSTRDRS
jgi:predicted dithiol-disulfide oxidoreductase (DUF899 family)